MIVLGLTGSIGMGKSTTSNMFRENGIPVHDADASVHELYSGPAAALIDKVFPGTSTNGTINRVKLADYVIGKPDEMKKLEAIIHPLVAEARNQFLLDAKASGAKLAVLDIPLLFETGGEKNCDYVVVVTAPPEEQRRRVLTRNDMDEEKFEKILARQMPDSEKRKRADFIINTGNGLDSAKKQVLEIIRKLKQAGPKHA